VAGTNQNVLVYIPAAPEQIWNEQDGDPIYGMNDWIGKPLRFSIELETELRTQLNEIGINWRPIHGYLM
jgi:hypothetical protein